MYSYIFNFLHLLLFDEFTSCVFVYLDEIFRNIFYDISGNALLVFFSPSAINLHVSVIKKTDKGPEKSSVQLLLITSLLCKI